MAYEKQFWEGHHANDGDDYDKLETRYLSLKKRVERAMNLLNAMIDGGEECRGRDSEVSEVIRALTGLK